MTESSEPKGFWRFWTTLPGILTAVAAVIAALTGLIVATRPSANQGHDKPPSVARMGPLLYGVAYLQADIYSRPSSSAEECATFCGDEEKCKAMTYIRSQRLCWLKDSVPATASSNDMVSAVKETN